MNELDELRKAILTASKESAKLEAALAERDKRIAELEEALRSIEKCSSCAVSRLCARDALGMLLDMPTQRSSFDYEAEARQRGKDLTP